MRIRALFASYGVNRAADKFRLIQKGETKKEKVGKKVTKYYDEFLSAATLWLPVHIISLEGKR